ncbi:hypothetical protein P152DRAFT_462492 [Eremomyces bilateralis CBS 781.70]|uniref:PCI domain-containing protein n=1 Tax=Eremomyces bilateralis CBS 781.70 TaxID=1392243 RepID=A0A6G1FRY5_9PEZI|nr:uncharacterized protein P152DRAFT_462492 [Eremomyces bilateralis CBS 781.70]KAF1808496.1 hypothetical protein P152DRAFT_462492 [Eremomyces bilateralis CBS 781.70]
MAMETDVIANLLGDLREEAPDELQVHFLEFEDFWERKLWHELTMSLIAFFQKPESQPFRLRLFNQFISDFKSKISPTRYVELGLFAQNEIQDVDENVKFIQNIADEVDKPSSQDALVYALSSLANTQLKKGLDGDAKKILDRCQSILDAQDDMHNTIRAFYYEVYSTYWKHVNNSTMYYRTSLLYLSCIDIDAISKADKKSRAYDLGISALDSDQIYNFGELLLHPIVDSLKDTEESWLRDLMFAFNRGDLQAFDVLQSNISKNAVLQPHKDFLYEKLSLSALTEAVFRRPPQDRAMTFAAISNETKVSPDRIEHLIMKALSLGLLRGSIDQVDEVARINWVQPKVLDMDQIEGIRHRLKDWDASVNRLGTWIEGVGKDVWAA